MNGHAARKAARLHRRTNLFRMWGYSAQECNTAFDGLLRRNANSSGRSDICRYPCKRGVRTDRDLSSLEPSRTAEQRSAEDGALERTSGRPVGCRVLWKSLKYPANSYSVRKSLEVMVKAGK